MQKGERDAEDSVEHLEQRRAGSDAEAVMVFFDVNRFARYYMIRLQIS